jgi:hypothetical protein
LGYSPRGTATSERVAPWPMTGAFSRSKIWPVPMLECPYCGIPQYVASPYAEHPRCVECDAPLPRPQPSVRQLSIPSQGARES